MSYYDEVAGMVDTIHGADHIPFLHADSGTGKTAFVHSLTERDCVVLDGTEYPVGGVLRLLPGSMEPGDLLGIPFMHQYGTDEYDSYTDFSTPAWAVSANGMTQNNTRIVYVFVEEVTRARPDVLDLLHVVFETRRLPNGYQLGSAVKFILAGNDPEHDPSVRTLSPAMTSRLVHLDFDPDLDSWLEGLIGNFGSPASTSYTNWASVIAAYLRAHPDKVTDPVDADRSRGWANRRTWTNLCSVLSRVCDPADVDTNERAHELARGVVGTNAAAGVIGFAREMRLPSTSDVLAEPQSVSSLTADEAWAVLTRLASDAAHAEEETDTHDANGPYLRAVGVLNIAAGYHPDVAAGVLLSFIDHATTLYGPAAVAAVKTNAYGGALDTLTAALG